MNKAREFMKIGFFFFWVMARKLSLKILRMKQTSS